jgi:hypothetical protein
MAWKMMVSNDDWKVLVAAKMKVNIEKKTQVGSKFSKQLEI